MWLRQVSAVHCFKNFTRLLLWIVWPYQFCFRFYISIGCSFDKYIFWPKKGVFKTESRRYTFHVFTPLNNQYRWRERKRERERNENIQNLLPKHKRSQFGAFSLFLTFFWKKFLDWCEIFMWNNKKLWLCWALSSILVCFDISGLAALDFATIARRKLFIISNIF